MCSLVICVMPNCSVSQQRSHQSWYLSDCNLCIAMCSVQPVNCSVADSMLQLYMHDHTHSILMNRYVMNITVEQSAFSIVFSVRPEQNILHCIACVVLFCIGVLVRLDGGQRIVLFPVFDQNKTYCGQCIAVKHIAVLGRRKNIALHVLYCWAGWTGGQRRRRQW